MGLAERMVINIKNRDLKETLQILQTWFSPLFPIGGYSFSHGLEAMINDNLIKTENDILDHLNCLIKFGSFKNDSILIKYSYNGEELNDLALSLCTSKERKIETLEMGNSFRKVLMDSWDYTVEENTAYPIIIGKAAKYFNLPLDLTLISFLQSTSTNLINVCVKHIPVGQKVGQNCTVKTYKLIKDMQSKIESFSLDDLGGICFNNDLYSIKHENIKTRIYKT